MQLKLKNWMLTNSSTGEKIPASVPGDITSDLYNAGKIADPYYALNHHDCYKLCKKNYVYTTEFDLPEKVDFDKLKEQVLECFDDNILEIVEE